MRFLLSTLMIATMLASGCSKPKPRAAGPIEQTVPGASQEALDATGPDIGDAEYNISCEVDIDQKDRTPQIDVQETKDYKGNISLISVEVSGPSPAQLPITCTLRSTQNFASTPVVVRARVLREFVAGHPEEIGTFSAIAGADARSLPKRGEGLAPATWTFDALKGLSTAPETLLVTVESTLLMTAPGTAEATLNADTAEVAADFRTVEVSNPLRIDFHTEPPANQPMDAVAAPAVQ